MNHGLFHIHIDATVLPNAVHDGLLNLGFYQANFGGHPEGYPHFEPNAHFTLKVPERRGFLDAWEKLERLVESAPDFVGYLEGEHVQDTEIPYKAYTPGRIPPFSITTRRLRGVAEREEFRESELHFTLDRDQSDQRLITSLLDAGLYGAYMPKADHTALVLTMQAARHRETVELTEALTRYINDVGGAVRASMKIEVILRYRLFGVTPETGLPPVVDRVAYAH